MQRFWLWVFLALHCFTSFFSRGAECVLPTSGLVGYWNADFDAVDFIGGNDGALVADATIVEGKYNGAFSFDGDGGHVALGAASAFYNQDFTVQAWVRRKSLGTTSRSTPGAGVIFSGGLGSYAVGFNQEGYLILGHVGLQTFQSSVAVTDLEWHHVAVTKSGLDVRFYVDGVQRSEGRPGYVFSFPTEFAIGGLGIPFGFQRFSFLGDLDDVAVYNRGLTAEEVLSGAGLGNPPFCLPGGILRFQQSTQLARLEDDIDVELLLGTRGLPLRPGGQVNCTVPGDLEVISAATSGGACTVLNGAVECTMKGIDGVDLISLQLRVRAKSRTIADISATYVAQDSFGATVNLAATMTLDITQSCSDVPSAPIRWWRAESSTLDSVQGVSGVVVGNSSYQAGVVGQAFVLDGLSAIDVGGDVRAWSSNFTVEFWMRRGSLATSSSSVSGTGALMGGSTGSIGVAIDNQGKLFVTQVGIRSTPPMGMISDMGWHHVAISRAGSQFQCYVDGNSVGSAELAAQFAVPTTLSIGALGAAFEGDRFPFIGAMDEVSIYDRPLTDAEVRALSDAGALGRCAEDISLRFAEPMPRLVGLNGVPFSLVAQNQGKQTARGLRIVIPLAAGQSIEGQITPSGACSVLPTEVRCDLGDVPAGSSIRVEGTVRFSEPGTSRFSAFISRTNGFDLIDTNNSVFQEIQVQSDCAEPPPFLLSWWSGNGNSWDLFGNALATAEGVGYGVGRRYPQSFAFSGQGRLKFPALYLGPQTKGYTWSLWVNPSGSTQSLEPILDCQVPALVGQWTQARLAIRGPGDTNTPEGTLLFQVNPSVESTWENSSVVLPRGKWTHVALAVGSKGQVGLFVNGAEVRSLTVTPGRVGRVGTVTFGGLELGKPPSNESWRFHGRMEDIYYFDQLLGVDTVAAMFQSRALPTCQSDLSVVWTRSVGVMGPGEQGEFGLVVRKQGTGTVTNAQLSVTIPEGLSALRATLDGKACVLKEGLVECPVPTMSGIMEHSVELVLQRVGTAASVGSLYAEVTSLNQELSTRNNLMELTVELTGGCVPLRGLAAWFPMDGDLVDRGGKTRVEGGEWEFLPGRVGQGVQWTGASGARILGTEGFPTERLTVECWIRRTSPTAIAPELVAVNLLQGGVGSWGFGLTPGGGLSFGKIGESRVESLPRVLDLKWHHVAVVWTGTEARFYVDGVNIGAVSYTETFLPSDQFQLGHSSLGERFFGALDELGIHERALTEDELRRLFLAGGSGRCFGDLALSLNDASRQLPAGQSMPLNYVISNHGSDAVSGSRFLLAVPTGFRMDSATVAGGSCRVSEGRVECTLGSLEAGASTTVSLVLSTPNQPETVVIDGLVVSPELDAVVSNDTVSREFELTGDCQPMPPGLIAWWNADTSLLEYTGTQFTVATPLLEYQREGRVGRGFRMGYGRRLRVEQPAQLIRSEFTLAAWIRPVSRDSVVEVIAMNESETGPDYSMGLGIRGSRLLPDGTRGSIPSGNLCFALGTVSGMPKDFSIWTDARVGVPLNRWTHVALTVDAVRHAVAVYVNGVRTRVLPVLEGELEQVVGPLVLGGRSDRHRKDQGETDDFDGDLDEIMIFGRALSVDEVQSIALAGGSGVCGEDISVFPLEETPKVIPIGQTLTLRSAVKNLGRSPAHGVVLQYFVHPAARWIDSGIDRVSSSVEGILLERELGTLAPGSSREFELKVGIDQPADAYVLVQVKRAGLDATEENNVYPILIRGEPLRFVRQEEVAGLPIPETAGVARVSFSLVPPPVQAMSIRYKTTQGTAREGTDYVGRNGTLELGPAEAYFSVDIPLLVDDRFEGLERFGLDLSVTNAGPTVVTNAQVLIESTDLPPRISAVTTRAQEGTGSVSVAEVVVRLEGASDLPAEITVETFDGTASAPTDYERTRKIVVLAPGETETRFQVPLVADSIVEPDEYFHVRLVNPFQCTVMQETATVVIFDDDTPKTQVDRFEWSALNGLDQLASGGFAHGELVALNALGEVLPQFEGAVRIDAFPANAVPSPLVISEIVPRSDYGIELMNVTERSLDVSGWKLLLFDGTRWPAPTAEFRIPHSTTLQKGTVAYFTRFPGTREPGEVTFALGESLDWAILNPSGQATSKIGVLLLDSDDAVRDCFFAGEAEPSEMLWPRRLTSLDWEGKTLPAPARAIGSYQRVGARNEHRASSWLVSAGTSFRRPNPGIIRPWLDNQNLEVTPDVAMGFQGGRLKFDFALQDFAPVIRFRASDGNGHEGYSSPVHIKTPNDTGIALGVGPELSGLAGTLHIRVVVTNPGPATLGFGFFVVKSSDPQWPVLLNARNSHGPAPSVGDQLGVPVVHTVVENLPAGQSALIEFDHTYNLESKPEVTLLSFRAELTPFANILDLIDLDPSNNSATADVEIRTGCAVLEKSPIAWWTAESGTADRMGRAPAEARGAVTVGRGRVGNGFHFGETGGALEVQDSSALTLPAQGSQWIEFWMRTPAEEPRARMVLFSKWDTQLEKGYRLELRRGLPVLVAGAGKGIPRVEWVANEGPLLELRDGLWHHVGLGLGRSASNSVITIDGVVSGIGGPNFPALELDSAVPWIWGADAIEDFQEGFVGELDELTIGEGGSVSDFQSIVKAGAFGRCAGFSLDRDGDGMEDAWELAHGLDPNRREDAALDRDADGASNLDEFVAGTRPDDAASVFRVRFQNVKPESMELTWSAVVGKRYQVVRSSTLAAGDWSVFKEIPGGVAGERVILVERAAGASWFYAVRVMP